MAQELAKKADAMFKRFPASKLSRLHYAIISDPESLVRDGPDDSAIGRFFNVVMYPRPERGSISQYVERIALDTKSTPAQANKFLQLIVTKMRELDPNVQKREIARDLAHGEMAGLPGFRNVGKEAPVVKKGTNYGDLPEDVARHITGFLKEPSDITKTAKQTLAAKKREVTGTGRRRTLKKRSLMRKIH